MPTYYTYDVCDVKKPLPSVKDFALKCAEAFLIEYRDGNYDSIRDNVEPYLYHKESLAEAQRELEDWQNKSVEEKRNQIIDEINRSNACDKEFVENSEKSNERIKAMLQQVNSIHWPEELRGLVKFMNEQLETSIDNYRAYFEPVKLTDEIINERLALKEQSLVRTIKYHQENWDKEQKRTAQRNQWVKTLKETLNV